MPMHELVRTPTEIGLDYEDVYFNTPDGVRLHGWWLPAQTPAQGSVVFFHGNAENISTHIGSVYWLPAAGFNVFLLDYRGYGLSAGEPSLPGINADAIAALQLVMERSDIDTSRVVVLGQSLGAAVSIYALAHSPYRTQIKALVVDSVFAGHRQITQEKLSAFWLTWPLQWPLAMTVSDDYSPKNAIASIAPVPLLVIHGTGDRVIPIEHSRQLFALAGEPKTLWEIPDAQHIQALKNVEIRRRLVAYLLNAV
ncbi:MAG: alpha/beta hydrolase, partial [Gammaproteobacteria bacterium]|nr:alpha/beta hydrolase [Gammaproteobacteria bacterium]